jgi:hypothetical protein
MFRRRLHLLLCPLALVAGEPAAPAPAAPPKSDSGKSQWVFSILPKSMQKNPLLDLTVITEMTDAGRKLPPVSATNPAYFEAHSSGFKQLGDPPGNEKSLSQEEIEKVLVRALASSGYRPAAMPDHPPTLLIFYTWGSHNRKEEADADNPTLSAEMVARNVLDRAALVGGEKFAAKLVDLFQQADAMQAASTAHIAPGGQPVITPEMMDFANPVAMFRRASAKNDELLEQTSGDVYYVVASAYDYRFAAANRRVLLWRTRMTVAAQGVSQEQTLPTLVLSAAPYFGKDMAETEVLTKRAVRDGTVEIGTPVVVPSSSEKKNGK